MITISGPIGGYCYPGRSVRYIRSHSVAFSLNVTMVHKYIHKRRLLYIMYTCIRAKTMSWRD